MDPLGWLGLRDDDSRTLRVVHDFVQQALPNDEPVVHRYVVAVCVLLTRVARVDGAVDGVETEHIRDLLGRLNRIPPAAIDRLCDMLLEQVPAMNRQEHDSCISELKALCDAGERRQVVRLLAGLARVDGTLSLPELDELTGIADALGVDRALLDDVDSGPQSDSD